MTSLFLFQSLLGDILDKSFPSEKILFFRPLDLPQIIVHMMPPSVLLATVFTLSGLSRTNELIACHSIGIGVWRIMSLILSIVFIASCLMLVMEDRILPPTFKKQTSYYWREMRHRPDFFLDIKKDKIWY